MKIHNLLLIALGLLLTAGSMAQNKTPMTYAAFFKKDMERTDGLLPVYRQAGKCYLELPAALLGRDFLFVAQPLKGSGGNGLFTKSLGVATFRKYPGDKLALFQDIRSEQVEGDADGFQEEMLQPVEYLYPIVAYAADSLSPIIDITTLIQNGKDWFTLTQFPAGADAKESFLQSVEKVPEGVKFNVLRMHSYGANPRPGQKGYVPAEISFTLRLLPRETMTPRLADPRVGYQTQSYRRYTLEGGRTDIVTVIHRWDLSRGPLIFTLAPTIPDWARPGIIKGITDWQKAFEQAGLKDALQVKNASPDEDLTQTRMLVTFSTGGNTVASSHIVDPRSGEILSGRLNVSHSLPASLLSEYLLLCGATDPRILADPNDPRIVESIVRWQVSREVGRLLGLEENRAGSAAYSTRELRNKKHLAQYGFTASVMDDCSFNYVAQPQDRVDPRDLIPRVGTYDCWAIRYGYTPAEGTPREVKQALTPILAQATHRPDLRYMPTDKWNPYTQRFDLASDKIRAAEYGMKNLERLIPYLDTLSKAREGEKRDLLRLSWLGVTKAYQRYLKDVASLIGGRMLQPVIRGYNDVPCAWVPKQEQREAMDFLAKYLFNGVPEWLDYSVAERNGWQSGKEEVRQAAKSILRDLLKKERVELLLAAEQMGGKQNYGPSDLSEDLNRILFHRFDGSASGAFARTMQQLYVSVWMGEALMGEANTLQNDYALATVSELSRFRGQLAELSRSHSDEPERRLYRMLLTVMDRGIAMDGKSVKDALMKAMKQ